ncbi:MAG TPA: glucosamine-6-phosphate deaminase [Chitinophagaceae bacterium]|nr:glucosamine-6-phosphate deaminase [Chitinophagaceae bacterium]
MHVFIADTYASLSKLAAEDVLQGMSLKKQSLLCAASGDTPAGLYSEIVDHVRGNGFDISGWQFVGLDEWVGMNETDEGSCRFNLDKELFQPLSIPGDRIGFFNGRAENLSGECEKIENFILEKGGIDVAILGLGLNGHIGMNEPGTSIASGSHVTRLDPLTQQTGQKYFKNKQILTEGITLGLSTLMQARQILLLVNGAHKAGIVKQVMEGPISDKVPASLLRNHAGFTIYLDKESARDTQF